MYIKLYNEIEQWNNDYNTNIEYGCNVISQVPDQK